METPNETSKTAVLLIAHGSRRAEANADLDRLAEMLRARGTWPIVETAYLEVAAPDIPTGAERCVSQGASEVRMLPYFLSAGAHVVEDLERFRSELAARWPNVDFRLVPPLGLHPLMLEIVIDRLRGQAGLEQ
jgi:sirohydrochlorin ferrochelatase